MFSNKNDEKSLFFFNRFVRSKTKFSWLSFNIASPPSKKEFRFEVEDTEQRWVFPPISSYLIKQCRWKERRFSLISDDEHETCAVARSQNGKSEKGRNSWKCHIQFQSSCSNHSAISTNYHSPIDIWSKDVNFLW